MSLNFDTYGGHFFGWTNCFFSEQDGGRQEDDEQFYMILWTMLLCGSLVNLVLLRVFLETGSVVRVAWWLKHKQSFNSYNNVALYITMSQNVLCQVSSLIIQCSTKVQIEGRRLWFKHALKALLAMQNSGVRAWKTILSGKVPKEAERNSRIRRCCM